MRSEAYLEIGQKRLYVAHERERIELIDLRIVRDDEQIADELLEPLLESSALRFSCMHSELLQATYPATLAVTCS